MKTTYTTQTTLRNGDNPINEDYPQNEDNLKMKPTSKMMKTSEMRKTSKMKTTSKNEDNLNKKTISIFCLYPVSLSDALTTAADIFF